MISEISSLESTFNYLKKQQVRMFRSWQVQRSRNRESLGVESEAVKVGDSDDTFAGEETLHSPHSLTDLHNQTSLLDPSQEHAAWPHVRGSW